MAALREKSERLTGYLETLIRERLSDTLQIATPREPERRGAQLSLRVVRGHGLAGRDAGRSLFDFIATQGVLGDWREPDVIRISPAPMYNNHADVLRFVRAVERSEEHTSELQSLMRISYAVFCLKKKRQKQHYTEIC